MNQTNRRTTIAVTLALLVGVGGGYWWANRSAASHVGMAADSGPSRKVLYWYDPMAPGQHFPKAGKSPMGMDLVPRYADSTASSGVRIDPGMQQDVGIRIERVQTGRLSADVRVPATLTWDLRQESVVSARVDGIVSHLDVKAPFERVRRGQALATLLAPQWSSAIAESRALDLAQSADARSLRSSARQRLRVLGLSGNSAAGDGGVVLRSPSAGIVSEVLVREGQTAMAGTPLFRINGTSTLWLEAAIPQAGTEGIGPGTRVVASVSAVPGRVYEGQVETLLPQVDPTSRTQRARIVLRNDDGLLVPGMFAELRLQPERGNSVALIPTEALIATGSDSRVIVVAADGSFQPVRVQTGRSGDGRTEILAGLQGGERVVTSGQFLIDSEASLSGALERLDTGRGKTPAPATATPPGPAMPGAHAKSGMPARQGTQMDSDHKHAADADQP